MMKRIIYIFTIINILFEIIYSTLGRLPSSEISESFAKHIFSIFRPEYLIVSGPISLVLIILLLCNGIKERKSLPKLDLIFLAANVEYVIFYSILMVMQ